MKVQFGTMTVGDILHRARRLLLARCGTFLGIQALTVAPVLLLQLACLTFLPSVLGLLLADVFLVLYLLLQPIASGAVLKVLGDEAIDRKASVMAALRFALSRARPLLVVSFVANLAILLGCVLLIVPGILWAVSYAFVGQVVVLEELGCSDALHRSTILADGHRWCVFGLLLVVVLLLGVAGAIAFGCRLLWPGILNAAICFVLAVGVGSYAALCFTLAYFDLRARKEGFDLEAVARSGATR